MLNKIVEKIKIIIRYIKYLIASKNHHAIHSPFMFDLVTNVIYKNISTNTTSKIESLRSNLCRDNNVISVKDFGAGSNINKKKKRKIKDIAKNSSKNKKFGELLYRIVEHYKPKEIFELGTSFGISTLYLSKANLKSNITTFEGCEESAKIALDNFKKLDCANINTIVGEFGETFSKKLAEKNKVNMVFIDGNHSEKATIKYFDESIKYSDQKTILIFDDIHWSSGMEKAWSYIKKSQNTRVTVDLFFIGLVFLDQKLSKENFIIRF